jgi:N-acetylglutamate synthase-like GNAT family acetyltransferase
MLRVSNYGPRKLFGRAPLTIYYKPTTCGDFEIEAKSAVLWDIEICEEEDKHKGIGSEFLRFVINAKSRGAKRIYACDVQAKRFFAKMGFVRTNRPDWWMLRRF